HSLPASLVKKAVRRGRGGTLACVLRHGAPGMVSRVGRMGTLALVAALTAASILPAAGVDPALFQDLRWRLIGPFRGGRVLAVAGVPGEREHFYFGSVTGGVWETVDAGRTWQPIFDGQPISTVGAIALAPSD